MEDVSPQVESKENGAALQVIDVYDIFLTDGRHLRYCTASTNLELMDWAE